MMGIRKQLTGDYDFSLAILTVTLSSLVGLLCIGGTVYTFFAASADPAWTDTAMYPAYLAAMNSYLFFLLAALIIVLVLCIPRRLFRRRFLVIFSAAIAVGGLVILIVAGLQGAALFLLAAAACVQTAVVALSAARSRKLTYVQEGFLIRMGSALLHLGLIVLVAAFVPGFAGAAHLWVFWAATFLIMLGMIMSFYSGELSRIGRRVGSEETAADT